MIQKHDASQLHYDFRLQLADRLKSWVIPKGPSLDPADKRLALLVEDHPLDYADFEGVIPEGEYGAGVVMVWDKGRYRLLEEENHSLEQAIEAGKISFQLLGEKLRGGWTLVSIDDRERKNWLLIKRNDEFADREGDIIAERPLSAKTGRSLSDIK